MKIPAIVINRIGSFFFLLTLLSVFLYLVGTGQGFMDETQIYLLRAITVLGTFLLISSLYGLVLHLVIFIRVRKIRYLFGFIMFIFFALAGGIAIFASGFINIIVAGNAG